MDPTKATVWADDLFDTDIGDWKLGQLRGSGKSAIVCSATRGAETAAIKVFEPELVKRFGRETQLERINRELRLRGHDHPHVVKIIDGGECPRTKQLFVVMELIDVPNLENVIQVVPRRAIRPIIGQLAEAARYLESRKLAHRDIKPSNIAISTDFQNVTLLDLGVLKPFAESDLTDADERPFVGTLRYSSPEFLTRDEEDNLDGWRAVTFYQIGAVLHDLIMRAPLFAEFTTPYARLVEAVKSELPVIHATDVDADLIVVAQNCLVKPPDLRRNLVSWDTFAALASAASTESIARSKVRQRRQTYQAAASARGEGTEREEHARTRALEILVSKVASLVRLRCVGNADFPSVTVVADDARAIATASFEPSEEFGLIAPLAVYFSVTLLSATEHALVVSCAACLGECAARQHEAIAASVELYRGVYEEEAISLKIEDMLYSVMYAAQDVTVSEETPLRWLNLTDLSTEEASDG
ncbi:MAG TPA: protein kinase [Lacipirellulaceae bacterium]|nr:protein kinase [Lacipirellulaceae bacterium]HMP05209.1 protein kinase [Lacipirellulaceae bacterium]